MALDDSTNRDGHHTVDKKDVKVLFIINNRMPIISVLHWRENYENPANRVECLSPKTRLVLLAGMTILSMVSAMCFLLGIRFAPISPPNMYLRIYKMNTSFGVTSRQRSR